MSRIHEALQRAYLERGRMPVLSDFQVAKPESVAPIAPSASMIDTPPLVEGEIDLESIVRHVWKPATASLPTLADRGAGVEQFRALRSHVTGHATKRP